MEGMCSVLRWKWPHWKTHEGYFVVLVMLLPIEAVRLWSLSARGKPPHLWEPLSPCPGSQKELGKKCWWLPKSEWFWGAFIPLKFSWFGFRAWAGPLTILPARPDWKLHVLVVGSEGQLPLWRGRTSEQQCRDCVSHTLNAEFVLLH